MGFLKTHHYPVKVPRSGGGREGKAVTWKQAPELQGNADQPGRAQARRRWQWELRTHPELPLPAYHLTAEGRHQDLCLGTHCPASPRAHLLHILSSNTPSTTTTPKMQASPGKEHGLNNNSYYSPARPSPVLFQQEFSTDRLHHC